MTADEHEAAGWRIVAPLPDDCGGPTYRDVALHAAGGEQRSTSEWRIECDGVTHFVGHRVVVSHDGEPPRPILFALWEGPDGRRQWRPAEECDVADALDAERWEAELGAAYDDALSASSEELTQRRRDEAQAFDQRRRDERAASEALEVERRAERFADMDVLGQLVERERAAYEAAAALHESGSGSRSGAAAPHPAATLDSHRPLTPK